MKKTNLRNYKKVKSPKIANLQPLNKHKKTRSRGFAIREHTLKNEARITNLRYHKKIKPASQQVFIFPVICEGRRNLSIY